MPRTIAINGTRLDKVRMPAEPFSKGVILSLSYPTSQIRYSLDEGTLCLVLPAYLSVELYRIGILPQDVNIPVRISIGGRPVGRYIVSDVRYPTQNDSPFGQVTFTLTRVLQRNARSTGEQPLSQPAAAVSTKYVTDITHYLDETGELAQLPGPARRLASFLTLLIEAATGSFGRRARLRDSLHGQGLPRHDPNLSSAGPGRDLLALPGLWAQRGHKELEQHEVESVEED